ncbi:carbonic anhydrase [Lachnotalea glycerini]|uniref:carbonic anhydrase n=1 Tax=Lachnotalea glycerini TaxID=1763509 RepID=A0A318EXR0_9FIRM|nr:carbonic anhydrase [Lachnotalea glycerini]PXV95834.1 carbonic anhydrase [Lachnotalea glycerini]
MIDSIIDYNKEFVKQQKYLEYQTESKYPNKKIAILSCMDTRLTHLLPAALGIKNGDCKIIKNAGGVISHPYGSVVRSLLIAIFELGVEEIMVIGHTDCGVGYIDVNSLLTKMKQRNISKENIDMIQFGGIDFQRWLGGFENVSQSVRESIHLLQKHPLIPKDITIRGFVMNIENGKLEEIE